MAKQRAPLGFVVLPVVAVILAALAALFWQFTALKAAKEWLENEKTMLAQANARLQAMAELERQASAFEQELAFLQKLLPDGPEEDRLLVDLQSGADLAGMRFVQVRFGEPVARDKYFELPLNLVFEGSYHQLLQLLQYLEVYERALRIEELRMDRGRAEPPGMTVNMRASVFYSGR